MSAGWDQALPPALRAVSLFSLPFQRCLPPPCMPSMCWVGGSAAFGAVTQTLQLLRCAESWLSPRRSQRWCGPAAIYLSFGLLRGSRRNSSELMLSLSRLLPRRLLSPFLISELSCMQYLFSPALVSCSARLVLELWVTSLPL